METSHEYALRRRVAGKRARDLYESESEGLDEADDGRGEDWEADEDSGAMENSGAEGEDMCGICGMMSGEDVVKDTMWIACDTCNLWMHATCSGGVWCDCGGVGILVKLEFLPCFVGK